MANAFDKYLSSLELNDPASIDEIENAEKTLEVTLPSSYKEFLRTSNGAEGDIGENFYLMLWKVDELAELNEAYGVDEFAEGLLLIGSDGGDIAFGFDKRTAMMNIIAVPFIGMSLEEVKRAGGDFVDFLKNLYEGAEF
ncbi:SMI1/KNR4 family protein [Marinobacter sp.]|jgi:SMI1/KNR4 family protein SUKH-1|uniref:SMI1/KNR4 family protein n=1 Tax=Marinobacter sp. TaxID=50741 RepID=UPI000C656B7E|nr:SMI1/KNR4 family protein [Marinobacter sp.]MBE94271.1 SMI1/KNR4 family protein [Marinobacter sp.]MBP55165.1 SMI1/KNR4 family protein [Marinobacter sp.]|tara:strand:- start:468 stop:884 length:417 start_codon:yes stop_codon:yes gene_type:complete